jgi:hypothetical protein
LYLPHSLPAHGCSIGFWGEQDDLETQVREQWERQYTEQLKEEVSRDVDEYLANEATAGAADPYRMSPEEVLDIKERAREHFRPQGS